MAVLTTAHRALVESVATADMQWRAAKVGALAKAKLLAAEEVLMHSMHRDMQVRAAFAGGVPKAVIGKEGLHTSSPVTVIESLDRTEALAVESAAVVAAAKHWLEGRVVYEPGESVWIVTADDGQTGEFWETMDVHTQFRKNGTKSVNSVSALTFVQENRVELRQYVQELKAARR